MGSMLETQTVVDDPTTSPGYRAREYAQNPQTPASLYSVDVNGEWTQNSEGLLVFDDTALELKVINCLAVILGEEWNEPTAGSRVTLRCFDGVTTTTTNRLQTDVFTALSTQMKYEITLVLSGCKIIEDRDAGGYYIVVLCQRNDTGAIATVQAYASADTGVIAVDRTL